MTLQTNQQSALLLYRILLQVFIAGGYPHWFILSSKGELRCHPMGIDNGIVCMANFHNINCPHGFLYFNKQVTLNLNFNSFNKPWYICICCPKMMIVWYILLFVQVLMLMYFIYTLISIKQIKLNVYRKWDNKRVKIQKVTQRVEKVIKKI